MEAGEGNGAKGRGKGQKREGVGRVGLKPSRSQISGYVTVAKRVLIFFTHKIREF